MRFLGENLLTSQILQREVDLSYHKIRTVLLLDPEVPK